MIARQRLRNSEIKCYMDQWWINEEHKKTCWASCFFQCFQNTLVCSLSKRSCAQESPNWTGASHLWCAVPVRSSIHKFVWEIDRISRPCFIFVGLTRPYFINQVQLFLFPSRKLAEVSGTCVFWMFKGSEYCLADLGSVSFLDFSFSRPLRQNTPPTHEFRTGQWSRSGWNTTES